MAGESPITRPKWRIRLLLFIVMMGVGFLGGSAFIFNKEGPLAADTPVLIPKGASLKGITDVLVIEGAIDFPAAFYWIARVGGDATKIRAGEFMIPKGASHADVLEILKTGDPILHKITFPEGLSVKQVVDLLNADLVLEGKVSEPPTEGSLLPETYLFPRGTGKGDILNQMQGNQAEILEALWNNYDGSLPFKTKEEALIIASIVEEETAVPEERALVAAVFLNRLEKRMRLQSDPTVIYGLTGGYPLGRPIRQSELDGDTPYNTYVHYGLPPTPISNPGRAAIEAVFNPAKSSALYFVADGTGGHVFAETLDEHNENVRKWRRIQRERGER